MSAHRKPAAKRATAKPWKRNYNPVLDALTKQAPKNRAAAMRKDTICFTVKRSEWRKMKPATRTAIAMMFACLAKQVLGAAWQRRQKGRK